GAEALVAVARRGRDGVRDLVHRLPGVGDRRLDDAAGGSEGAAPPGIGRLHRDRALRLGALGEVRQPGAAAPQGQGALMETLLAVLIAIAAVVLAAFGIGRAKGKQAGAKEAEGERQKAQSA